MNKLFTLAHMRLLNRLGATEITAANAQELLSKNNIVAVGESLLYRLPRDQLKHILNIPCPINSLEQVNATAIIAASKILRHNVKAHQDKICARCALAEKCPSAKQVVSGQYENTAKDIILYFQGLNNYLQPDSIYYRQWVSGYKIVDSVIASIEDLAQGGKEIQEYDRLRIESAKSYEERLAEMGDSSEKIEDQKFKRLEEKINKAPRKQYVPKNEQKEGIQKNENNEAKVPESFLFDDEEQFIPKQAIPKKPRDQKPRRQQSEKGYQQIQEREDGSKPAYTKNRDDKRQWNTNRDQRRGDWKKDREGSQSQGKREWTPRQQKKQWTPREGKKEWTPREEKKQWTPRQGKKEWTPREGQKEWTPREGRKEWTPREGQKEWTPREGKKEWTPREGQKEWKPRQDKKEWTPRGDDRKSDWKNNTNGDKKDWKSNKYDSKGDQGDWKNKKADGFKPYKRSYDNDENGFDNKQQFNGDKRGPSDYKSKYPKKQGYEQKFQFGNTDRKQNNRDRKQFNEAQDSYPKIRSFNKTDKNAGNANPFVSSWKNDTFTDEPSAYRAKPAQQQSRQSTNKTEPRIISMQSINDSPSQTSQKPRVGRKIRPRSASRSTPTSQTE